MDNNTDRNNRQNEGRVSTNGSAEGRLGGPANQAGQAGQIGAGNQTGQTGERSSFYERAARRMGERLQRVEQRFDPQRREQQGRGQGSQGGGFGQGGYGRFGGGGEGSAWGYGGRSSEGSGSSEDIARGVQQRADGGRGSSWSPSQGDQGAYGLGGYHGQGGFGGHAGAQNFGGGGNNNNNNEGYGGGGQNYGGGGNQGGGQRYVERFDQAHGFPHREGQESSHRGGGQTSFGSGQSAWGGQYGGEVHDRDRTPERRNRWQREAITAGEIMTSTVKCVSPETSLLEVARIMKDENVGVVPVVDQRRKLTGMVTDRDLVVRAAAEGKPFAETRVSEVMSDDVEAVTPDEELRDVIELMGKKQVRRVPVVDRDDRLLGIISMGDIANRADYDEELQEALERVSSKRSFWSRLFT